METRAPETDTISRIGLLFGCMAIILLALETGYEAAKIANIGCNLIACFVLQRGITQEAKRFGTSNDNDFELPSL